MTRSANRQHTSVKPALETLETRDQPSTLAGDYLGGIAQQAYDTANQTVALIQKSLADINSAAVAAYFGADPGTQSQLDTVVQYDLYYLDLFETHYQNVFDYYG